MNTKDLTPTWVKKGGLRWVWGLWEPLMFYRRAGYGSATAVGSALWNEAYYNRMHSEEIIGQLAEIGVNCISTHYFKGFGMVAEAEEQEKAADLKVGSMLSAELFIQEVNLARKFLYSSLSG